MNEVTTMPTNLPAPTEGAALAHMIERAARDPSIDLDKLDRLLAMHDRMVSEAREQEFNNAMALAQSEMEPVKKDCDNPQTRSRYASYAALDKVVRPIYSKNGFALSFNTQKPRSGSENEIGVVCYVTAKGHTRIYDVDMPIDGKGAKGGDVMTRTHATGSGISYGRRYLMQMIFNLATEDDDGNAAGGRSHNKPAAAQGRQDKAETSAPAGAKRPHKLEPLKGDTFEAWAELFVAFVAATETQDDLTAWGELNQEVLLKIKAGRPAVYKEIGAAVAATKASVAQKTQATEGAEATGKQAAGASENKGDQVDGQDRQPRPAPAAADPAPTPKEIKKAEPDPNVSPKPYIKRTPAEYVAYCLGWLGRAPDAATPNDKAIDQRWSDERAVRNGLADKVPEDDMEKLQDAKGEAKARAKAAPYVPAVGGATSSTGGDGSPGAKIVNPEAFRKGFATVLADAKTVDEADSFWARDVEPHVASMLPPDVEDLRAMVVARKAELAP